MQADVADATDGRSPHVVTLLGLANDLLRRPWVLAALVLGSAIGSALVRVMQPRTYTAIASFVPETALPIGGGISLAALAVLGGAEPTVGASTTSSRATSLDAAPSPLPSVPPVKPLDAAYYWEVLHSRALLLTVAGSRFTIQTPTGERVGTAADLYDLPAGPAAARIEDAARKLDRELEVDYDVKTNVLTVGIRTFDPTFARAVTERVLAEVMATNRRVDDDRAQAKVGFLTRAVAVARGDLLAAQDELARFLASNRAYVGTSAVALEFRRRDTDVLEKRGHYAELALQLERAKLDRSRATQIISIIQRPETPPRPDSRGLVRATIAGAVGGLAVALLFLLTSGHLARLRGAGSDELRALESEWRAGRRRRAASRARRSTALPVAASEEG